MTIKIKPKGPKTKRRENRLIVTKDDERVVYLAQANNQGDPPALPGWQ
jgi:hypothetical protein